MGNKKKICFPVTFRGHEARQKLLLDELRNDFDVQIWKPTTSPGAMSVFAIFCAIEFNNYLSQNQFDAVLIRGDRYELMGLAMVAAYKGLKIIHIEGGDLSSVIDNKVRHAITHLSDLHFCTNEESHRRLISMGLPTNRVWNFGSLDAEFAISVKPNRIIAEPYILVAYHGIPGEEENEVTKAVENFKDYKIVNIQGNKDYGKEFKGEEYAPEDYINLIRFASVCVGNSSSFLKEASVLGTLVVNVGARQDKRLKPANVLDVNCYENEITRAIYYQLGKVGAIDHTYFKSDTSIKIAEKLKEIL